MRRFIRNICLWGIAIALAAIGMDYVVSKGLLQMEDYRFDSWRDINNGSCQADILICGNSRGLSHFDPAVIDSMTGKNSYCIGMGGHTLNTQMVKYRYYRAMNKKPSLIIWQVDPITLCEEVGKGSHESEQFLPEFWYPEFRKEVYNMGYSIWDKYMPMYRYFGYQMVIKNGLLEGLRIKHYAGKYAKAYKGHMVGDAPWNGTELRKMDSINISMNKVCMRMLENMLADAHRDSIKVLLVNSPTYIGATAITNDLDILNNYFDSIAQANGAEYWNYSYHPLCMDTANFSVSVHLRQEPMRRFTKDFCSDLIQHGYY